MIFLYLALAWLMGFGLLRWLFPAPFRWSLHTALLLSISTGVGIGIASSLYFLTLALAGPKILVLALVQGVALAAALALCFLPKRKSTPLLDWAPGPSTAWYFTAALCVALASAVTIYIFCTFSKPHGDWDAWAIWNLRARFLVRGGEFWRDAFSNQIAWSHPDYPLLVPGIIALIWTLAQSESILVPAAVGFLFVFSLAGVFVATLGILRGKLQSFIGGIVLLCSVSLIVTAANQYADAPLSFFVLATLGLLCLQERYPEDLRFTILAGLTAGFAAWTKNEGELLLVALIVARAWAIVRYGNRATLVPQFIKLALGLAAPLAIIVFFKLKFAPANDLLSHKPGQIASHLTDLGRWITVLEAYVVQPFRIGTFRIGSILAPIILLLGLYWYFLRFKVDSRDRASLATILCTLAITLAGEFLIYVALPGDADWQLSTSFERLLLHLWPAGLLAFFLAVNTPQLEKPMKPKQAKKAMKPAAKSA
ncbi:MAG TPA: hypothetical protein VKT81_07680 [Bryobacteraceae bacterium]|nr:hypothetical protein [Bryobacteraceae bacterium]